MIQHHLFQKTQRNNHTCGVLPPCAPSNKVLDVLACEVDYFLFDWIHFDWMYFVTMTQVSIRGN